MRLYLDSADRQAIRVALGSGIVYGVTTNPTILRRAGLRAAEVPDLARTVLGWGARELLLQTYAADTASMVADGRALAAPDRDRIIVKIPATPEGYAAGARLAGEGYRVALTAVYTLRQAVLAGSAGACCVAVYLGRIRDSGDDALALVGQMQRALEAQRLAVAILAASVRDPAEVDALAGLGVAMVTLPPAVFARVLDAPGTAAAAAAFRADAEAL